MSAYAGTHELGPDRLYRRTPSYDVMHFTVQSSCQQLYLQPCRLHLCRRSMRLLRGEPRPDIVLERRVIGQSRERPMVTLIDWMMVMNGELDCGELKEKLYMIGNTGVEGIHTPPSDPQAEHLR